MARLRTAACLAGLILAACGRREETAPPVARAWEIMGTVFSAGAWGRDSAALVAAVMRAHDSVRLVDSLLSPFRDDSEISRLNREAGSGQREAVSPTFAAVLGEALRVARASGGAFDPTLRDWRGVEFDSAARTVRLRRGLRLDFGGIAKGYALDRAALALEGVADSAVLNLGGQLLVLAPVGASSRAAPDAQRSWPVGIADPDRPLSALALIEVPAGRFSVSTSSQAEQPGHIRDPRTGRPAARARSVTVVAPSGSAADAWSTALFVLGCDSALDVAERVGVSALCADDRVRWTRDLDGRVSLPTDSAGPRRGP
ncbi:MAG TPA: FAD:protein FMN transferase [Gemmatimonadales bacterium]|nr:FAD:protein FMN transferase [Gemmatimonadales bacterium]